jgi:uncharacterized membrane protein
MNDINSVPVVVWIVLAAVLFIQGFWMFNDASKRGLNKWLWGALGLLNTPTNLIVYLVVSRTILGMTKCENCEKKYNSMFTYCPHCGTKQTKT